MSAPPTTPRASWSEWLTAGVKDVALSDEQLQARDLSRADPEVTKRFGKGTHYNLKVVVKGDLGTGKSCLLKRLRGGGFVPSYEPSPQIATTKISWSCAAAPNDVISIEVWEVIDRASKKTAAVVPPTAELSLEHRAKKNVAAAEARPTEGKHELVPLDATVVDVYAGAHAVIFMIDPSKPWTLDYVVRELAGCPLHLPVAVLVSFRDYSPDRRVIHLEGVEAVLCAKEGPFGGRTFRPQCFEASMANCFGLHTLHAFLTVPFLAHKRAELQRGIELNTAAMGEAHTALASARRATYDEFVASLEAAARAEAMRVELARAEAEAKAAAAAKAEADKWAWLTGDAPPGPPRPGAPGDTVIVASYAGGPGPGGVPVVLPGGGIFARGHPGRQSAPGGAPPGGQPGSGAPAPGGGGVAESVLSYLGVGSYFGGLAAGLVGSSAGGDKRQQGGGSVKLDDFLGPDAGGGGPPRAVPYAAAPPGAADAQPDSGSRGDGGKRRGGSSRRRDVRGWDSDDDSSDGERPQAPPSLSIPSMRTEQAPAKPYVLDQPGSSDTTPRTGRHGDGGAAPPFGAQQGGHGRMPSSGSGTSAQDIPVGGGSKRPSVAGGKGREWDESDSD